MTLSGACGRWCVRATRLALILLLISTVVLWRPAPAAAHPAPAPHGIVNIGLLSQVLRLQAEARPFLQPQQALPSVPVEITASRDVSAAVRGLGGTVETDIGGSVLAARVPAERITALAAVPGVRTIFPSRRLHLLLDQSVPEIRAPEAWALKNRNGLPIRGNHVLIGIIDSGIDYRNPDFRNPNGSTRIKYIWDQTFHGHPPSGFSFGYECNAASINAGSCAERDTDGHGTHVAGIAAGNGSSSTPAREIGVAPQADLIVVKTDLTTDHILAAWKYMIARAHQLGEPIVINNSFGGMLSPHDGSAPDSLAADRLSGPGRVFVVAAGNEGNRAMHAEGTLVAGGTAALAFDAPGNAPEITISAFFPAGDSARASLIDEADGAVYGPLSTGGSINQMLSSNHDVQVSMQSGLWNAHFHEVDIDLSSVTGSSIDGHFRLALTAGKLADAGRFDAWVSDDDSAKFIHPDESDTIGDPADGHQIISVGNYATRVTWVGADHQTHNVCDYYICLNGTLRVGDIKASSSTGPTADGRQKPDLAAPGTMIISSLSADARRCDVAPSDTCLDPAFITPDGKNYVASGTSMSAPHVAGVVALMLEANPTLTPAQVDSILRSTARHDQFTGPAAWTPAFGAGKVDAYAAVQRALAMVKACGKQSKRCRR